MIIVSDERSKLGSELSVADQRYVLAAFVNRHTRDHPAVWAKGEWRGGKPYPMQFASDADWLAHTRFAVTKNGNIDRRVSNCESMPTWPDNPELRANA